ncbi:MAG: NAD(P)H-binding protein [Nitrospirae bacterium]|nr:NAD(P)H-binding protein [Nitrospirota bacterium]
MYTITGATGNTGKKIAEALIAKGQGVRVIGRSAERLRPLADKGAEPFIGSLEDASALTRAFTGMKAVYVMIPPNYQAENFRAYQNKVGEALSTAIAAAQVPYVVNLSSLGAHLPEKTGPIKGLYAMEQRLNKLDRAHVLHLRPTYFMENLFWSIHLIKTMGMNGSPLRGDLPIPMIATKDIAAEAIERLLRLDFAGKSTKELLGQRDLTMPETTRILGKAIGKPDLPYAQFSYEDAEKAMVGMGLSIDMARSFNEMYRAFNEGTLKPTEARSERNTTPTSIEEFSQVFAAAYKS